MDTILQGKTSIDGSEIGQNNLIHDRYSAPYSNGKMGYGSCSTRRLSQKLQNIILISNKFQRVAVEVIYYI